MLRRRFCFCVLCATAALTAYLMMLPDLIFSFYTVCIIGLSFFYLLTARTGSIGIGLLAGRAVGPRARRRTRDLHRPVVEGAGKLLAGVGAIGLGLDITAGSQHIGRRAAGVVDAERGQRPA